MASSCWSFGFRGLSHRRFAFHLCVRILNYGSKKNWCPSLPRPLRCLSNARHQRGSSASNVRIFWTLALLSNNYLSRSLRTEKDWSCRSVERQGESFVARERGSRVRLSIIKYVVIIIINIVTSRQVISHAQTALVITCVVSTIHLL